MSHTLRSKVTNSIVQGVHWTGSNYREVQEFVRVGHGKAEIGESLRLWVAQVQDWVIVPVGYFIIQTYDATFYPMHGTELAERYEALSS